MDPRLFYELVLILLLIPAAVSDRRTGTIPNRLLLSGFFVILTARFFVRTEVSPPYPGLLLVFLLCLFAFWKKRLIGGGDVKLYLLIVLCLPDRSGAAVCAGSFVCALLYGLAVLIRSGRRTVPMAECALVSAAAAALADSFRTFLTKT